MTDQTVTNAVETPTTLTVLSAPAVRTFTQEEVDKLLGQRLYEERAKYADYAELKSKAEKHDELEQMIEDAKTKNTELQSKIDSLQRDIDIGNIRKKVSAETGIPADLLTGETEESCKTQAEAMIKWRSSQVPNYPSVKDGGEIVNVSGGATRDQFAAWFENALH